MSFPVVKSAERTLLILEYLDQVQREVSVNEVSQNLKFPQSSTSMLMRSLTHLGYLHYDRRRRTYVPTARLALLGTWVNKKLLLDNRLVELMEALNIETGDTVVLAAQNGIYAQYIRVVQEAGNALRIYLTPGTLRSLFHSATGHALLSSMEKEQIENLVKRYNTSPDRTEALIGISELEKDISTARQKGYAQSNGWVSPGVSMIAMPLPTGPDDQPLALGVARLTEQMEKTSKNLIDTMRSSIDKLLST